MLAFYLLNHRGNFSCSAFCMLSRVKVIREIFICHTFQHLKCQWWPQFVMWLCNEAFYIQIVGVS